MEIKDTVWQSDDLAGRYLEGVRSAIPMADEQLRVMLTVLRAAAPSVGSFLDLGCGDGVLGRAVLAQHPDARGVFLDFSDYMLDAARAKLGPAAASHVLTSVDYGQRNWTEALKGRRFDAVVSGFSIHHQQDERKREIYREIFELLNPGGIFLNLEHVASASTWGEAIFEGVFVDALYAYHERRGGGQSRSEVADAYYGRPDKAANILAPVCGQVKWLEEIGYVRADCFFKVFELALFGGCRPL